jgi:hypothetical protein
MRRLSLAFTFGMGVKLSVPETSTLVHSVPIEPVPGSGRMGMAIPETPETVPNC